jgi:hypothetical protein
MPVPIVNVFYSMSWPLHFSTAVIVLFFWLELASTSNIKASGGFLTTQRWPAAIACCTITFAEFASSAARAANTTGVALYIAAYAPLHCQSLTTLQDDLHYPAYSSILYVIILSFLVVMYCYVYYQVRKFFSSLPTLSEKQELISKISLRFLLTACTFVVLIVSGLIVLAKVYYTPVGQPVVQFIIYSSINLGSTLTISAFFANMKLSKTISSRRSSLPARDRSGVGSTSLSLPPL